MNQIEKSARVERQEPEGEMALINRQSLRELAAEEVFTFRLAACDDQVDRDYERFTVPTLKELAGLYVGKTVIMDHQWSARNQTARIYAAGVETEGQVNRLVLRAYMLRGADTAAMIAAIEGGILREVSVGCAVRRALCSVCGADKGAEGCPHQPGAEYGGVLCHVDLDGAEDAYEVSFTPVPAQRYAGVVKQYGGKGCSTREAFAWARARQALEEKRYGGNEYDQRRTV